MAQVRRHLKQGAVVAAATLVAGLVPTVGLDSARAATTDAAAVVFYTPRADRTVSTAGRTPVHLVLGTGADVAAVQLSYSSNGAAPVPVARLTPDSVSHVVDYRWSAAVTGPIELEATAYAADGTVLDEEAETVTLSSASGTRFEFVRPVPAGDPLGVFRRADGHAYARASGFTTATTMPTADAPTVTPVVPASTSLAPPPGTLDDGTVDPQGRHIFRVPVDLTGNPGLSTRRAVIRVDDGTSSEAADTPLYIQTIGAVTSTTTTIPGSSNVTITAKVTDQYGQVVVGALVRLKGYVNGSRTPVSQYAVSDAHDGLATFTNRGAGFPAGFYTAYVDINMNNVQAGKQELGSQQVVGTVTRAAPGHSLYHNNKRTRGASGTVGDSLKGTRTAAARHFQWIDQDGQLSYTSPAVLRGGVSRVSQPAHVTWINAHGAPFNPRWLKNGRFETRAWSRLRKRAGLRNADMTFKQNAAYGLSVEWEVKNIRPFTSAAALNAAFANLAAAAQRYYGAAWRSRVQVKMLSNLSGGQRFALRVLKAAHAQGFTTIYLARGNATRVQIPASAHAYVTYVRGARAGLYAQP